MYIATLLDTEESATGNYTSAYDWWNLTLQVNSKGETPFEGTVYIEGTLDENQETARWQVIETLTAPVLKTLSLYALAGIRARAELTSGGVAVVAAGL